MQTLTDPTRTSFSFYIYYCTNFKLPQNHKSTTRINIYNKITKNSRNDKNAKNDVKNTKNDIFMQEMIGKSSKKDRVITLVVCFGKVKSSVWIYDLNPKTK